MGRPINKRNFGFGPGNQIKVRAKIGSNAVGEGFIVRQRGSKRFVVTVGANTGVCTLVDKDAGSLAANEMIVNVINDAGQLVRATKLYNRVAIVAGAKTPWNFDASLDDGAVQVKDVEGPTIVILTQPQDVTVDEDEEATFTVVATGVASADLTYNWEVSTDGGVTFGNAPGTRDEATYTIAQAGTALDGNQYRVVVNAASADAVTSEAATLTVIAAD